MVKMRGHMYPFRDVLTVGVKKEAITPIEKVAIICYNFISTKRRLWHERDV